MLSSDPHNETHTHTHIHKDIYICKKFHCLATQWASLDNFENTHCACLHLWSQISHKLPQLKLLAFNMIRILGHKKRWGTEHVNWSDTSVRNVTYSNLSQDTNCGDWGVLLLSQFLQTNFRTSPDTNATDQFLHIIFISLLTVIQSFDDITSELETAFLS